MIDIYSSLSFSLINCNGDLGMGSTQGEAEAGLGGGGWGGGDFDMASYNLPGERGLGLAATGRYGGSGGGLPSTGAGLADALSAGASIQSMESWLNAHTWGGHLWGKASGVDIVSVENRLAEAKANEIAGAMAQAQATQPTDKAFADAIAEINAKYDDKNASLAETTFGMAILSGLATGLIGVGVTGVVAGLKYGWNEYQRSRDIDKAMAVAAKELGVDPSTLNVAVSSQQVQTSTGQIKTVGELTGQDWSDMEGSNEIPVAWSATVQTGQPQTLGAAIQLASTGGFTMPGGATINPVLQKFESEMGDISFIKSMSDLTGIGISAEDSAMIDQMVQNSIATLTENVNEQNVTEVKNTIADLVNRGIMDSTLAGFGLAEVEKKRMSLIGQGTREFETWGMGQKIELGEAAKGRAVDIWGDQADLAAKMGSLYEVEREQGLDWQKALLAASTAEKRLGAETGWAGQEMSAWEQANKYNLYGNIIAGIWGT